MNTSGLHLLPNSTVGIIWNWIWQADDTDESGSEITHVSETTIGSNDHYNPHIHSDSETEEQPDEVAIAHTLVFKFIGSQHDSLAQDTLMKVRDLRKSSVEVLVRLLPEPQNEYDSKAIAFQCELNGKWLRIGYVVREALDCVHLFLECNYITKIEFAWVKYMLMWTRSGPGFYAGINPEDGQVKSTSVQAQYCTSYFFSLHLKFLSPPTNLITKVK